MNGNEEVHGSAMVGGTKVTFAAKGRKEPTPPLPSAVPGVDGGLAGVKISNGGDRVSGMNGDESLGRTTKVGGTVVSYTAKN
jgi:hypothetical protein